jgi:hypothetical protein
MVSIQQSFLAQMSSSIHGVAGYYSETDCTQHLGGMQHVVVATTDGILHEMHWNQYTHLTTPQPLKRSPGSAPVTFPVHFVSGPKKPGGGIYVTQKTGCCATPISFF